MKQQNNKEIIENLLKNKDLTYCKKSSWWINILKKAIKSKEKEFIKTIEEFNGGGYTDDEIWEEIKEALIQKLNGDRK